MVLTIDKDIYLHNGFRIFNLPITASSRKVTKEFNKIESMKKLNNWDSKESLDINNNLPFPINPKPNFIEYQNAKNRLTNSRQRFIDEIFWFWPEDLDNKTDETIMALKKGDSFEALKIWQSSSASNSTHNIAVYNHISAIDMEISNKNANNKSSWKEALKQWNIVLSSNDFKNLAKARIRQLNDPTIKEDYVEEVFTQLPLAILSINVAFANEYFKVNDRKNFSKHLNIIKESNFNQMTIDESLKDIFNSLYEPIKDKFEDFKDKKYKRVSDIPKVESFLDDIEDDLNILKENFSDDYQYQLLSDDIAKEVKSTYLTIFSESGSASDFDFNKLLRTFERLKILAYTPKVKQDIEDNISQLEGITETRDINSKMSSFKDNVKYKTIRDAKRFADDIKSDISRLDGESKKIVSDNFAYTLNAFVYSYADSLKDDVTKLVDSIDELLDLLYIARDYANEEGTIDQIESNIKGFKELKEAGKNSKTITIGEIFDMMKKQGIDPTDVPPEKIMDFIQELEKQGYTVVYETGSSGSGSSGSGGSGSGSGSSSTICAIIIIIIIIAVILHFIGIF